MSLVNAVITLGGIILKCNKNDLDNTEKPMTEGKFARAVPIVVIALWLVFYLGLGAYFYIAERVIPAKQYTQATELLAGQKYEQAYTAFAQLEDYKDSQKQFERVELLLAAKAEVGDTVLFGMYDKKMHGRTDGIEWIVLDKQADRVLVISKESLGTMNIGRIEGEGAIEYATRRLPYVMEDADEHAEGSWGASLMRGYLHRTLASTAMSESRLANLVETVHTDRHNASATDALFLLSNEEAKQYFSTDGDRQLGDGWWLRTEGEAAGEFCYVNERGEVCDGKAVGDYLSVRPAMWINIGSVNG